MEVIRINQIKNHENKIVRLNGWVYNSRRSGKIGFLMVRDGFGLIQCIIEKSQIGDNNFEELANEKFNFPRRSCLCPKHKRRVCQRIEWT